ncbi:hypothetical protein VHEMI04331 [[Torrubiella] hemipterigena]|uniref:Neprosin PEP catalytic domain-containing protein n=1 Tax=[Torrubiella] hemipterigena TaxID=1531966 RepID=A0A0A1SUZ6_9HYPO|nr:hypothetical protein VHEMI04331 [[Torrubiella] hemipterigena]
MYAIKLSIIFAATLAASAIATPLSGGSKLDIVKTTVNANGDIVDWVVRESQGDIAEPPPLHLLSRSAEHEEILKKLIIGEQGPPGAVPRVRARNGSTPIAAVPKPHVDEANKSIINARDVMAGFAATVEQRVTNRGGSAKFNLWNQNLATALDSSSTLVAVSRTYFPDSGQVLQNIQAGIFATAKYPQMFVAYTTNTWTKNGDYIGSVNTDFKGWVQYDTLVYPKVNFDPSSSLGGTQYELEIGFHWHQENWWVHVAGRWVGYYPGTLFSKYPAQSPQTLTSSGDVISYYGWVWSSRTDPRSQMGSGENPDCGDVAKGTVAYIKNLSFFDLNGNPADLAPTNVYATNPNFYNVSVYMDPPGYWGRHMWLGGSGTLLRIPYPCPTGSPAK